MVLGCPVPTDSPLAAFRSANPSGSLSRLLGRRLTVDDSWSVKSEPLGWALVLRGRRFKVAVASTLSSCA